MKKIIPLLLIALLITGCSNQDPISSDVKFTYGVFLGCDGNDLEAMKEYKIIVLDAQYFAKKDIETLKEGGRTVLSYLNIGSIENFREYYKDYEYLTLGEYEHWEEERWVDVSRQEWRDFIINELAPSLIEKGVDGFYLDNSDVYYEYETDEIFDGLKIIYETLRQTDKYIMINGGDTFVYECINRRIDLHRLMDAVNQETVYTSIDWDNMTYGRSDEEDRKYFKEYVETIKSQNLDVFLLEYGNSDSIINDVNVYCYRNCFYYYFADTIDLLVNKNSNGSQPLSEINK